MFSNWKHWYKNNFSYIVFISLNNYSFVFISFLQNTSVFIYLELKNKCWYIYYYKYLFKTWLTILKLHNKFSFTVLEVVLINFKSRFEKLFLIPAGIVFVSRIMCLEFYQGCWNYYYLWIFLFLFYRFYRLCI